MATLVLSTVGTMLGGPIGGAIGGLLGQSIDQQVFGPGPREGPRLGDLTVQTSTYGSLVPKLFGTMRVAGCIVWSTDLQEDSQTQGAKGQPETVTYSYSVSFAVALSSRPIRNIKRIWADGKLIRGEDGEFSVSTVFRFHDGSEAQEVDPLIGSIEGLDGAPAYRGTAYAVFEHLQLAEFGNRIPFLTFEVVADEQPVAIGSILDDVSGGQIASVEGASVVGYAAHGASIAGAVEPLVMLYDVPLIDSGEGLATPVVTAATVATDELGCSAGAEAARRLERQQTPRHQLPSELSVNYYEPAREYQGGAARSALDDRSGRQEKIDLPAVLSASTAKGLAETSLARRWAERNIATIRVPPRFLGLQPGSLIRLEGVSEQWRVRRVGIDGLCVVVEMRPVYRRTSNVPADPGRVLTSVGVEPAPTEVAVAELPEGEEATSDAPVVAVVASSPDSSSRTVPVEIGVGAIPRLSIAVPKRAVLGQAISALAHAPATLFDLGNHVDIELTNSDSWLTGCDEIHVSETANLALIGQELVQFGNAVAIGPGRFRLSKLLRGRRGTEWATGLHSAGELFLLFNRALVPVRLSPSDVGALMTATPQGLKDVGAAGTATRVVGEAMRPLSPVHLRAQVGDDGSLHCRWVRRSRRARAWLDGVDAPLDFRTEHYRATLRGLAGQIERETNNPAVSFAAGEVSALGGGPLTVDVVQIGDLAVSRAAQLTVQFN